MRIFHFGALLPAAPHFFAFSPRLDPDHMHSVILLQQSKPDDEQKRRDDADEHPCVAGPLEAVHFGFAFSPSPTRRRMALS
jgi:hypothetical protein